MLTATKESTRKKAAVYAQVRLVDVDRIVDNPWQPRTIYDEKKTRELGENIYTISRVLEPCLGRMVEIDGEWWTQLAAGHRRVRAAIRWLTEDGRWNGDIPVSVDEFTDAQMAVIALSENEQREDLTPIERFRAYKRAIEEIDELTVTQPADDVGVDRSTMSTYLRVLRLPDFVIEWMEHPDDTLGPRAAREFLALSNEDHTHLVGMRRVIKSISRTSGASGRPDWRVSNVRREIRGRRLVDGQGLAAAGSWDGRQGSHVRERRADGGEIRHRGVQERATEPRPYDPCQLAWKGP